MMKDARNLFRSSGIMILPAQVRTSVRVHREVASSQRVEIGVPNAYQLEPRRALASGSRRAQACGLTGLRGFLLSRRPFGRLADYALRVLLFVLTDRRGDSAGIEVVRFADGLADSVQLVNDGIAPLHLELPDGSSSGVQIIGGVSPAERQITSIVPRIVAFARCLQFQVSC